jgi:hypothetical protein
MEDNQTEVTESTEAPTAEASQPVETVEATEQGDPWESPLTFPTEASTEDEEPVAGETATPEVNESAEENQTEETPEPVAEPENEPEEEPESLDASKPTPLSRRKLREVEEKFITPLRDPDAAIETVWQGLRELNPQRADDLAQLLINDSASKHADKWIEALTGIEGATVESVKQKFSGEPTQPDTFQSLVTHLDGLYGDTWKDASQDESLLDEDRLVVQALRDHLQKGQTVTTEKDAEIAKLRDQLDKLQPEIETIKTQQEAEYERHVTETKERSQTEYQEQVMSRVVPKLLEDNGLNVSEQDTPTVRAAKEEMAEKFKQIDGDMSDFEYFLIKRFSQKEDLGKKMSRVGKYLDLAAKAEASAKRERDANRRSELVRTAEAYRSDAKEEQDSFVVLSQNAGKEFLGKTNLMKLIEENAQLRTQNSKANFRPEIVGQAAVAGATSHRDKIMQSDDPWGIPLSEGLT